MTPKLHLILLSRMIDLSGISLALASVVKSFQGKVLPTDAEMMI